MHTTSASLLERLREGRDAEAWAQFIRIYSPILYAWARKVGLRHDDAVDLTQDVFAVLVQKLPEFRYDTQQRFRGWLWTVTKHKWLERRRRPDLPLDAESRVEDARAPAATPPEFEEAEFRDHLIRSVVPSLRGNFHDTTWQAFWRQVVDGRPANEVAVELGLSLATVYKAKLRVLAHLHAELGDLFAD
ncbi:RNA polymerase sigma factor [Fimbriiglobus ruber]|nr:sigma-70 family RNA polymerase sigma factor [Fimbriiglobus ruber]